MLYLKKVFLLFRSLVFPQDEKALPTPFDWEPPQKAQKHLLQASSAGHGSVPLLQVSPERGLELGGGHRAKGEHGAETTEQILGLPAMRGFMMRVFFACRL